MQIFNGLIDFVARILAFLYSLPVVGGNYGLAVMMLTMVVMIVLMPLTLKATRSTIKMQQIQPDLRRLQKEYKDDRQAMNAEVMKLYTDNGISPVGGCLPMLAQLPVFLVLFRILSGLTRRIEDRPFYNLLSRIEGLDVKDGRFFDPQYLSQDSELYEDLSQDTSMKFGPFDLAERALDVLQDNFVAALPYIALIIFVVGSSYYQQRQVSARRTTDPNAELSPMMQQQQMLLKILPLMSGVWSFLFPSGLVLYWATSNLFRIGQQSYITHQIYGKEMPEIEAEAKRVAEEKAEKTERTAEEDEDQSSASAKKTPKNSARSKAESGSPKAEEKRDSDDEVAVNGASSADRAAAWEARRAQKAKQKAARAKTARNDDTTSSRVTPKGTKSGPTKKKKR